MTGFKLRPLFFASTFALALPTVAAVGAGQNAPGESRAEQVAQSQAQQDRLPAKKEGSNNTPAQSAGEPQANKSAQGEEKRLPAAKGDASGNAAQGSGGKNADDAKPAKKTTAASSADKGQADQKKKHPPTAAMDRATPEDKSSTATGTTGKHPAASAMDRATPAQKSPEPAAK